MNFQKQHFKKALFAVCIAFFTSCALAPVGSHFESASTINKKAIQVSGNFEKYDGIIDGDYEESNYNFGGTIGYGVSDNFDVKFRYQRMVGFDEVYGENTPAKHNFISVSPKYMVVDKFLSFKLPLSIYQSSQEEQTVFAIAPGVLGTWPLSQNFDLTGGAQYQYPFNDDFDGFLGLSVGFGASTDLDVWSIRPEIGWQSTLQDGSGSYFNYGLAFLYNFNL